MGEPTHRDRIFVGGITYTEARNGIADRVSIYINLHKTPFQAADRYVQSVLIHELGHALGLGHSTMRKDVMYYSYDAQSTTDFLPSTLDLYALFGLGQNQTQTSIELPSSVPYTSPPWIEKGVLRIESSFGETRYGFRYSFDSSSSAGGTLHLALRIDNTGKKPLRVINATVVCDWNHGTPVVSSNATDVVQPGSNLSFTWEVEVPSKLRADNYTVVFRTWTAPLFPDGWLLDMPRLDEYKATVIVKAAVSVPYATMTTTTRPTTVLSTRLDWVQIAWSLVALVGVVAAITIALVVRRLRSR